MTDPFPCTFPDCPTILTGGRDTFGPHNQPMCFDHWQVTQDNPKEIKPSDNFISALVMAAMLPPPHIAEVIRAFKESRKDFEKVE